MIQELAKDEVYFGIYCFETKKIAPAIINKTVLFDVSLFRPIQDEARLALIRTGSDLKKTVAIFAETRAGLLDQIQSLTEEKL